MPHSAKPQLEALETRLVPAGVPAPLQFNLQAMTAPVAWNPPSAKANVQAASVLNSIQGPTSFTGDFNGDGVTDFANFTPDNQWQVFISQRDQFSASNWGDWHEDRWQKLSVGDLNGDGRDDVVGLNVYGEWAWAISTGTGFSPRVTDTPLKNIWREFFVGNFVGDGRAEIVAWDLNAHWWMFRQSGSRLISLNLGIDWGRAIWWGDFQVGDFNGDRYADVAALRSNSQWWVLFGGATTVTDAQWTASWFSTGGWTKILTADVNGDRKSDILALGNDGAWYVAKSAVGRFLPTVWSSQWGKGNVWRGIIATDVDDDGRDDLVGRTSTGAFWTLLSTGKTPKLRKQASPGAMGSASTQLFAGDFNGDGRGDILVQSGQGKLFAGLSNGSKLLFGVRSPKPFFFVAPWDMNALRAKPSLTRTVFLRYLPTLKKMLQDRLPPLSENLYAMVFANIVAFEHASYYGVETTGKLPNYRSITSQLAAPKLECNNYDFLAVHLYRQIFPVVTKDKTVIRMVGWDKGPFGNHSQLLVSDKGITLLIDPNLALIARTDLASLLKGKKVKSSALVEFSFRKETTVHLEKSLNRFRSRVREGLLKGTVGKGILLYNISPEKILGYRK